MARMMFGAAILMMASMMVQAASEVPHFTKTIGEKNTRQPGNLRIMQNPSAMLTELEEMVHSLESSSFDMIATIKRTIEDDIMPPLQTTRDAAAQDTRDYLNAIQLCNNESKTKEGVIEGSTEVSVNHARSRHAACRDVEKTMYDHNLTHADSYCVKLGEFLHDAEPLRIPDTSTRDVLVQYVRGASDTNMCGCSEVTELADNCTAKEEELKNKNADCSAKQEAFQVVFCTWQAELELNCKALDMCHSTALTAYNTHVTKTQTLVEKWNVETAALQKILCYCDVWLSEKDEGDNRPQHNASQFERCKDHSHTPVPVNYGTPAEKVACLLTSVANHPGTPGFIIQEYSSFANFLQPVVPCSQAMTAAPTTIAPTTTQAPPTTTMATTTIAKTPIVDKYSFDYPSSLGHPADFMIGFIFPILAPLVQKYETPIATYQTMRIDQLMWNCVAAYHATALDATSPPGTSMRPPAICNITAHHTSQNRVVCTAHAINGLLVAGLNILGIEPFQAHMNAAGLDTTIPNADILASSTSSAPYWIGHKLAASMVAMMKTDGSNFDGAFDRWGNICVTKRCPAYGDTGATPRFVPSNNPWTQYPNFPTRWTPQLETNGLGLIEANGHVTPHFGARETFIINKSQHKDAGHGLTMSPYPDEMGGTIDALLAVTMSRVANTTLDPKGLPTVAFFDDKISLAGGMIMRMRERFLMSFEEQVYYSVGYTTAESDAVILAWEAKTHHNRARPTSFVQSEASGFSGLIRSFNGSGYGSILASQWDAMVRVMPHAEYPSGSGCICTVIHEYVDEFVKAEHGVAPFKTQWDLPSDVALTYQSMEQLRNACGDSRVDGGMHFTPAVTDSYQLCRDIGGKAYTDYVQRLLGLGIGSSFANAFPDAVPFPAPSVNMFTVPP